MGLQLINTHYFHPDRKNGREFDKVVFVVKNDKGEKSFRIVEKPVIEYQVTKPQYWDNLLVNYIEQEKVMSVRCYYKDIYKSIIATLNDSKLEQYFKDSISSGYQIGKRLKRLHLDYRLHGSDINIQDYYISEFLKKNPYENNSYGISKVVFDIETDLEHIDGFPKPEEAQAPVNIITLVDMDNMKVYTICLEYQHETYVDCMNRINEVVDKMKNRYKDHPKASQLEYVVETYANEIDVIARFYNLINDVIRPDFALAWNSHGFDNPYLMNRIGVLGYNPQDIICPADFPYKKLYYRKDTFNQDPADNSSDFTVAGYTIYLDAMNLYANLRKGMGKEESYSLDYIGKKEVGEEKDQMVESFKTFHLTDYERFFLYNIQDTIMLALMEWKNGDCDFIYAISMLTQTRVEKAMKKTICLRNLAAKFYLEQGAYISNNRAEMREHVEGKIKGAFVAKPENVDFVGMKVIELLSQFIFENCIDLDLSSLYPSIILALNISPETCYGRIEIFNETGEDISSTFADDYVSRDYVNLANKWFKAPSMEDMIKGFAKTQQAA